MGTRYEQDFFLWSQETAQALLERRFDEIDLEHVAEEIRDLGVSQRHELRSSLKVLLVHLLKCRYATERRSKSWGNTIEDQRDEIEYLLNENPSLRRLVPEMVSELYNKAVRISAREARPRLSSFPAEPPFTVGEILVS
jgi:hypothetical protein